jgi:hypothetical protein
MRTLVIATLAVATGVTHFAGRVYHILWQPEWTEAQAIVELWWVWALADSSQSPRLWLAAH